MGSPAGVISQTDLSEWASDGVGKGPLVAVMICASCHRANFCRQAGVLVRVTFVTLRPTRGSRHFTPAKIDEKSSIIPHLQCIACTFPSICQIDLQQITAIIDQFQTFQALILLGAPGCLLGVSWASPGCLLGVCWVIPWSRMPLHGHPSLPDSSQVAPRCLPESPDVPPG